MSTFYSLLIKLILLVALATTTACATKAPPEPIVRTIEVKVPVAVACVPAALGEPAPYVDTDEALKAAAGPEDRFQLLAAGRIQREARLAKVEPVIKGCRQ